MAGQQQPRDPQLAMVLFQQLAAALSVCPPYVKQLPLAADTDCLPLLLRVGDSLHRCDGWSEEESAVAAA